MLYRLMTYKTFHVIFYRDFSIAETVKLSYDYVSPCVLLYCVIANIFYSAAMDFPSLSQQYFEEDVSVMLYDSTETVSEQY